MGSVDYMNGGESRENFVFLGGKHKGHSMRVLGGINPILFAR